MSLTQPQPEKLALVQGILQQAFFTPLHKNDWLAFCLERPELLGLEEDVAYDLFIRAALGAETIYPELSEGRQPLARIWSLPQSAPVCAHVLASLRADRPALFHRVLVTLPAVREASLDPRDYDMVEDFLAAALAGETGMREAAQTELDTIYRRAMQAAGQDPDTPSPQLLKAVEEIWRKADYEKLASDVELIVWLALGDGLAGVNPALAPGVLVQVWQRYVGALSGAEPDLDLLVKLIPKLGLGVSDLALHAPTAANSGHTLEANCPFCGQLAAMRLGKKVEKVSGCGHLSHMGTSDEAHLLTALNPFDLGSDLKDLLQSYYNSPSDLDLFSTVVNDLYEMLRGQGRLAAEKVSCQSAPGAFYFIKAYFANPDPDQATQH
jgi:hypothetical protein